tara:strand:+ start:4276 stop:4575 length:300 start_codon:yes stop_codon:yes gene_type:complete
MKKEELIKGILNLAVELEHKEGVECIMIIDDMKRLVDVYEEQLNLHSVTNRTFLKETRMRSYVQGYRKRALMSDLVYDSTSENKAVEEFKNYHLNLYGW